MSRRNDIGDGDPCPLIPQHGNMFVLDTKPPKQYCAHVQHDGHKEVPRTRAIWPLYGLEDTVSTYIALADRAAKSILPVLEVNLNA
jgi:hypothetical protein